MEPVRTCEITGCGRPAKPSSINSYCDRHAGFLPWLGASAGMLGVVIVIGLVLAEGMVDVDLGLLEGPLSP